MPKKTFFIIKINKSKNHMVKKFNTHDRGYEIIGNLSIYDRRLSWKSIDYGDKNRNY